MLKNNLVLLKHHNYSQNGIIMEVLGHLATDILQQKQLIFNGMEITIKLWPNKDS